MKLTDLHPMWASHGGAGVFNAATGAPLPEREGVGVIFDCPCGCDEPLFVPFANPLDGQPAVLDGVGTRNGWRRTGETFETLTLEPSILRSKDHGGCGWHGFVRAGDIVNA